MPALGATLLAVLALALALHKLRRLHLLLFTLPDQARFDAAGLFRQLEALQGLYAELRLGHSLPATRGWAASPDFLLALARHALLERPRTVVECSSGVSTVVLARCMQLNGAGQVLSLEHDPLYAEATRAELARHGLAAFATVLAAPLRDIEFGGAPWRWYAHEALPAAPDIEMLVIDGPPNDSAPLARYPAGPALFHRLAPHGAVFLDDAARAAEVATLARWRAEFPQLAHTLLACEKGAAVLRRPSPAPSAAPRDSRRPAATPRCPR